LPQLFWSLLPCPRSPVEKFKSGLKDVITSPVQVCDNIMSETKNAKFFPFAFAGGLLKGVFYMGKNIVTGLESIETSQLEAVKKSTARKRFLKYPPKGGICRGRMPYFN